MHKPNLKPMEEACRRFNEKFKVGDEVKYWSGPREGAPKSGLLRFGAQIMGGHTAVAYISGIGSVALTHIVGPHS